ncbi:hypothetical protein HDU98_010469 [Podochytrium sp. JEL0797]|nr:hypothetical protein HDU98_010469 [Podochytrium sp. JEL0797]
MHSSSLNKVILLGNVGKDPQFRTFQNTPQHQTATNPSTQSTAEKGFWSFTLATNRNVRKAANSNQDGAAEWETETEWHNITDYSFADKWMYAQGQLARGAQVLVEGRLKYRKDEEGRVWTNVIAEKVEVVQPSKSHENHM